MTARTLLALVGAALLVATPAWAQASGKQSLPKGSYATSCTCTISGGIDLACFCANVNAKWFRTTMDMRTCQAPKDVKNCEGTLTCTPAAAAACPNVTPLPPKISR